MHVNVFEVLEVDLSSATPDAAALHRLLEQRIEIWSRDRNQGSPMKQRRAQLYLDAKEEIQAAIDDPATRARHAEEERRRQTEERQALFATLDERIQLFRGSGRCDEAQLEQLLEQFSALGERTVRQRLRDAGVSVAARRMPRSTDRPEPLGRRMMAELREKLQLLGVPDLYRFLEMGPQSSLGALQERAAQIIDDNKRNDRHDSRSTTATELAGKCKLQIFVDEETKQRYDAALAQQAMRELDDPIRLAVTDRILAKDALDHLVEMARRRGVEVEDALDYIVRLAERQDWAVQLEDELPAEALETCGFCLDLNPADATRCRSCGESLVVDCPRCGRTMPTSAGACQDCGCRTGDAPLVQRLVKDGRRHLGDRRLDDAVRAAERALVHWPDWAPAVELLAAAKQQLEDRGRTLEPIETLISSARLLAAREAIDRERHVLGRALARSLSARIETPLAEAEALFRDGEACAARGDVEQALDRYERCLDRCADHEAARRALSKHPPEAPSSLTVEALETGFRLRWSPSPSRVTGYRILRRGGGRPRSADDGERLDAALSCQLDDCQFDDVDITPGTSWFYALYAERTGVVSSRAATSGPHLRLQEVEGLEAMPGDGRVTLTWTSPPGCEEVEIERRVAGRGASIERARGERFSDRGLTNGETVRYRVVAVFRSVEGVEERTRGLELKVTPAEPPRPVLDLRIRRDDDRIAAEWTPRDGVEIELWRAPCREEFDPRVLEGRAMPIAQLDPLGQRVAASRTGRARDTLPRPGSYLYTAVVLAESVGIVGRPVEVIAVDPVRRVRCRRSAGALALTWAWPAEVEHVLVCWSYDARVDSASEHDGPRERVGRAEYEREGCWRLTRPQEASHYVSVFAESSTGALSEPAQVFVGLGLETTLRYRLEVKKKGLRRRIDAVHLALESSRGDCSLPGLRVVAKSGNVPISPRDGRTVAELETLDIRDGIARIDIPPSAWTPRSYFKIFWQDPSAGEAIRLLPAAKDQLCLS